MERYVQIKDSGVDWIREIPNTWCVRALFQLVEQVKNKNKNLIERNLLSLSYGKIKRKDINNPEGLLPESFDGYNIIEANDIVLRLTDLQNDHTSLRVGQAKERGIITSAYTTLRPTNIVNPQFLYYVLHAYDLIKGFYGMGSGVRQGLNFGEVKAIRVPFPPVPEQSAIVAYLDDQISQIDSIIAEAKTSIEEYKQWKASIIFEAVTKGLDPDVEMRNSGIDIIGRIPKHWSLRRLKFLCDISTGNQDTQDAESDGIYPFYVRSPIVERSNRYTYDGEGILMAGDGAGAGKVFHHAFGKYAIHQRVYCFHNIHGIHPKFLYHYLSNLFSVEMDKGSAKSTVPSVRLPMIQNFRICIPSKTEQTIIVSYIDDQISKIDEIIEIKNNLITDLEQYKRSLIYEVVTGKRKVV